VADLKRGNGVSLWVWATGFRRLWGTADIKSGFVAWMWFL